ncbi:conserved hypothetical protein [uncultured Mycobacterium sp.]|uniref:Uncharacterized protein n=1 Tax=uncultured Mycobacterium sp. TaxID=171292 RepID=A0A1Y5PFE5_9MYCO|nr:conserved hypothetical protein [uncultured Mycobacterium sp.]
MSEGGLMVVAATSRGVFTVSGDGKARAWPELPGQVMAMAVQDERVAVAVHKHGVFLATAGADHWTDLGDGLAHRDVRALAFDPHTPNALYAGTEPAHLLRWQDGIWAECGNVLGVPEAKRWSFPIRPGIAHVRTIAVHPLEADVVYVGIEVGSLLITRDRGQTWEEIDGLGHDIHRVVLHPEAPDRLIVTTGQDTKPYRGGKGIYRSTDRGSSWVQSNNGLGERNYTEDAIVVHPADPDVVFLAAADGIPPKWAAVRRLVMGVLNGNVYFLSPSKLRRRRGADVGFFRSNDGGASWVRLDTDDDRGLFDMVWALEGELTDGGELLLYHGTTAGGLYVSEDEGHTWKCLADGLGAITHIATLKKGTAQ